jgi:hypothetical protein
LVEHGKQNIRRLSSGQGVLTIDEKIGTPDMPLPA